MSVRKSCYVFEHRITFLGAARVGKSAIINQFIQKDFLTEYVPTSEHHLTYVIEHRGTMCVCLFVDTAGSDDFPAMRKLSLAKGDVFVVTYAIDDRKSFARAKQFVDEIKSVKGDSAGTKIMFVGNKLDLEADRKVTYEEGYTYTMEINFSDNIKACFGEVTAKEQDSVQGVLYKLLSMFKIPALVEVPVLEEKKILSKIRRHKKNKRDKKINSRAQKLGIKTSSSDSEFLDDYVSTSRLEYPKVSDQRDGRRLRRRADSSPNIKASLERLSISPPSADYAFKRRASSPNPKEGRNAFFSTNSLKSDTSLISSPKLISHSISLNKYTFQDAKSADCTDSKSSSDDSGVSDDSNSQGEISPKLSTKYTGPRRTSLSEKMKGMFKKVKSANESSY